MKNMLGIIDSHIFLSAKANSNEEKTSVQAPKQYNPELFDSSNQDDSGTRDETAFSEPNGFINLKPPKLPKRTRNLRNSEIKNVKGDSKKALDSIDEILNIGEKRVHIIVLKNLDKYLDENGKYNGIIRILNTEFLITSYSLIKSKSGNMTLGPITTTNIN
jgi:hypothetical protein